jgi:hypothetical protein
MFDCLFVFRRVFDCLFFCKVMSIKAVGISIKLTIEGINQAGYFQTWLFVTVSATCIIIQLVYLNKVQIGLTLKFR